MCVVLPKPNYHVCCPSKTKLSCVLSFQNQIIMCVVPPKPNYHVCCPSKTKLSCVLSFQNQIIMCVVHPKSNYHVCCPSKTKLLLPQKYWWLQFISLFLCVLFIYISILFVANIALFNIYYMIFLIWLNANWMRTKGDNIWDGIVNWIKCCWLQFVFQVSHRKLN